MHRFKVLRASGAIERYDPAPSGVVSRGDDFVQLSADGPLRTSVADPTPPAAGEVALSFRHDDGTIVRTMARQLSDEPGV
jgi:hypothetical protein